MSDHSKCAPGAHTRDPGENARRPGEDGDGELVDEHGEMLCNDCEQPLVYCETFDVYVHADPATPPCFLVGESVGGEQSEVST